MQNKVIILISAVILSVAMIGSAIIITPDFRNSVFGVGEATEVVKEPIVEEQEAEEPIVEEVAEESEEQEETTELDYSGDCHPAFSESSLKPEFTIWFEDGNGKVTSYSDKRAGQDWTPFKLMVKPSGDYSIKCDGTEYYNDEINDQFTLETYPESSFGVNPLSIMIEPKATAGTLLVKYRLTCYNRLEYGYKDTCEITESMTKSATIPIYFI